MTRESRFPSPLRPPLNTLELSIQQRALVEIMRRHQFGRIENLSIQDGQPVLTGSTKIVRVSKLGGTAAGGAIPSAGEFDLKKSVRDLFDQLAQLENGTVVRLEFRHGLPCSLETVMPACVESRS